MKHTKKTTLSNQPMLLLVVSVVFLLIVAVSYTFYSGDEAVSVTNSEGIVVRENSSPADTTYEKDTDGDGLADWEELLWNTDPTKADTDGDGILDGEEIYNTYDVTTQSTATDTEPLFPKEQNGDGDTSNTTETVARELFSGYLYTLREGGVTLTEQKQAELIEQSLQSVDSVLTVPRYTFEDIHVVSATQKNRTLYIDTVLETLQTMIQGVTSEREAIYAIGRGDVEWAVENLNETIAQYDRHMGQLETVAVPSDAINLHANMVQSLLFYVYVLKGVAMVDEDPLRAASSIKAYAGADKRVNSSYKVLREYMDQHYYNATEPTENSNG